MHKLQFGAPENANERRKWPKKAAMATEAATAEAMTTNAIKAAAMEAEEEVMATKAARAEERKRIGKSSRRMGRPRIAVEWQSD